MADFYAPDGNIEVWDEQPEGYCTEEEWQALHPELPYLEELAALQAKYEGVSGVLQGKLLEIQAAQALGSDAASLQQDYSELLTTYKTEMDELDEKYGVNEPRENVARMSAMSATDEVGGTKPCIFCAIPMETINHKFLGASWKCPRCGRVEKRGI